MQGYACRRQEHPKSASSGAMLQSHAEWKLDLSEDVQTATIYKLAARLVHHHNVFCRLHDLTDIVVGYNGAFHATPGYDLCTGMQSGSPYAECGTMRRSIECEHLYHFTLEGKVQGKIRVAAFADFSFTRACWATVPSLFEQCYQLGRTG